MKRFEDEFDDDDELPQDNLPAALEDRDSFLDALPTNIDYAFEPFQPVQEISDDQKTTESDLALLNNALAIMNGTLLQVRTIDSAVKVATTVAKLIEVRRKVKKLPYGAKGDGSQRSFEVLPDE